MAACIGYQHVRNRAESRIPDKIFEPRDLPVPEESSPSGSAEPSAAHVLGTSPRLISVAGATVPFERRYDREGRIKYAHGIDSRASEDLGLCGHRHPVLRSKATRAPSTCAGVRRGRVEAAGGARLRRTASPDTDHMHPGRVLSR